MVSYFWLPFSSDSPYQKPCRSSHDQNYVKMLLENGARQLHDMRSEPKSQHGEDEETNEPSSEDREQKMGEIHFEYRRRQNKNLEWHRWRQHSRKHQRPEFMLFERAMNFEKPLVGDAFTQDLLATKVADGINRDAPQG